MLHEVDGIAAKYRARTVFVGPSDMSRAPYNDTDFYYLLPQLRPSSFYLEIEPGVANVGTGLATDLQRTDLVITSSVYLSVYEPNETQRSRSQAANVQCADKMRAMGIALQALNNTFEVLPPLCVNNSDFHVASEGPIYFPYATLYHNTAPDGS